MIRARSIEHTWRDASAEVRCLRGLDLELEAGEFCCLRGVSGSGKTTLLLALGGMLRPSGGTVQIGSEDLYSLSSGARARARAQQVGFVFQMFHLVPYLSARDNLLAVRSDLSRQEREARADELLESVGLQHRADHRPAALSAGERQRVAVCRALFNKPTLILADEPTGNLDPDSAEVVLDLLTQYTAGGGAVLMATHSQTPESRASRTLWLRDGTLHTS
ncbi:MAG: ABC transporter ATP-binding protein [Planctomycetes bacterium]|nr:ABC transporter ATP-binding protein [Planctomycetota bacterium]